MAMHIKVAMALSIRGGGVYDLLVSGLTLPAMLMMQSSMVSPVYDIINGVTCL